MSLEQLEDWIDHLDPSPLVDGVSMLDGYLTATIVGPCSVNPYEWMDHVLGPHGDIGMAGTTQTAAIMAVAARFNAVSKGLATAPDRFMHRSLSEPTMVRFWPAPGAWGSWPP